MKQTHIPKTPRSGDPQLDMDCINNDRVQCFNCSCFCTNTIFAFWPPPSVRMCKSYAPKGREWSCQPRSFTVNVVRRRWSNWWWFWTAATPRCTSPTRWEHDLAPWKRNFHEFPIIYIHFSHLKASSVWDSLNNCGYGDVMTELSCGLMLWLEEQLNRRSTSAEWSNGISISISFSVNFPYLSYLSIVIIVIFIMVHNYHGS